MGDLAGYHLDRLRELYVPRTHVLGGVPDDRAKSRLALAAEGWLDRPGHGGRPSRSLRARERAAQTPPRKRGTTVITTVTTKKRLITLGDQPLTTSSNRKTSAERATGLEPATSSLGSRTTLRGSVRKSLIFHGERPAWFRTR
jgi:hypothetical protein